MTELLDLSALELARLVAARAVSPVELIDAVYRAMDVAEPAWHCFVARTEATARAEARAAEREIAAGHYRGPLHGIPIAVKDNIAVADTVTAAGARFLAEYHPPEDATAVQRLRAAGAIVVGKTNLSELALSSTTINPHFGTTRNPWAPDRVAGGSSGGSAAAVVGRVVPLALGTDTLGSIRMPASLCGIVGLKPTHGRVSNRGIVAPTNLALDHVGPLARTVADAAAVLEVLAGHDPRDPTSIDRPVPAYREAAAAGLHDVRIGVPTNYYFDLVDPDVERAVRAACAELAWLGATLVEVAIPDLEELMHARIALQAEGLAYHRPHLRAHPEQYSPELRRRLYAMHFLLARDYARANRVRRLVAERFARVFAEVDVLATPTTGVVAFPIGARTVRVRDARAGQDVDALAELFLLRLTSPHNFTGQPAITLPAGISAEGLPIGLQLVGRPFDEARLLAIASAYEAATSWHTRRPPAPGTA